ncbi:tRNA/tmRNA/rRNA uracil-C5-methylase (TrmA/RlmC/RlmD family) [Arcanobacterium wilhelmae]|uniref:tRNA/tmRNA/rRNA uracil-C5-methylase (TrmA/RlmC/RlmD family) n=1 Tax=Arcanobacterium wilhelmae TaxID=1803177 RepID=A0ABT9N8W6_9ACTO|nr:TRAM domain-containing protein [Arcanobacterium wilhelmae]MDP9800149.1 tRNA/tmRNA/rRNA uracil-C5-methylase (TrmA/RlmC/RlmD family) [Arcanobacterium wilhelmae]WFN89589.1 TRAM domain-containing protein [Arcanobacterium wilhelmae]
MKIEITDVAHGGVFVGRVDGQVVFVRGALPGEVVDVEVTKKRSKLQFARVVRVLEASPHRVDEVWPDGAAGRVGAADYQHAELSYQRELKAGVIRQLARRLGSQELADSLAGLTVEPVDLSDGWGRRTRFDLVKLPHGMGMHRESSHDLVALASQPLGVRELEDLDLFGGAWDGAIAAGTRVHVVAPASGDNVVVYGGRAYTAPGDRFRGKIAERATTASQIYDYEISPDGFWQVHAKAPSTLLQLVMAGADLHGGERVAEFFSGAGLFSLPIAKAIGDAGALVTMEGSADAVADARENLSGLGNSTLHAGKIGVREVAQLASGADVVIADPPRAGLGKAEAQAAATSNARRIVLVSCDPAAMARDAQALIENGRELVSAQARDIFPHTHHVEIVSVFE